MRLANGIVLDKEKTFGVLKFSALRHEVRVENEDGTTTEEIKRRTYDLKCSQQERTIQVSIPAEIPVKDYPCLLYTSPSWISNVFILFSYAFAFHG